MDKKLETNVVPEYYVKKIKNDYIFMFDAFNDVDFMENCLISGYFIKGNTLVVYLETEVFIKTMEFQNLEARMTFKLKRLKQITFMENAEPPFCYDLLKIKQQTLKN